MSAKEDLSGCFVQIMAYLFIGLIVFGPLAGWRWYKAGLQTAAYQRQGIVITRWEVFCGIEPAERVIQVRDTPK